MRQTTTESARRTRNQRRSAPSRAGSEYADKGDAALTLTSATPSAREPFETKRAVLGADQLSMLRGDGSRAETSGKDVDIIAAPLLPMTPQRLGYFDGVFGHCAEGWAIDVARPDSPLAIGIYEGGRRLGTGLAKFFRSDIAQVLGYGACSFKIDLPPGLFDGADHTITAEADDDSRWVLPGSPFQLRTVAITAKPAPTTPSHSISSALTSLTEAVKDQTRVLALLLERLAPGSVSGDVPVDEPLRDAALAATGGQHDYIFFGIIDWTFRIQRPQHLASRVAAFGHRVFYISICIDPAVSRGRPYLVRAQPAPNVFEIVLRCHGAKPSIYQGIDEPQLGELAAAVSVMAEDFRLVSPVAIVQFPSWLPMVTAIPGVTLLWDCLDHLAGFSQVAPRVIQLEEQLFKEADCITVSSAFLERTVRAVRPCKMVRNAADVAYFSTRPADVYRSDRPVIGYYGAIAEWFDIDLVTACARDNPDLDFVLIGEVSGCDITAAQALPNICFLGEQPYERLTYYLYGFDACIIPFKLFDLIKATNPVKVYEYLCAGKPVIATDVPELRLLPEGMVHFAGASREFTAGIRQALQEVDPEHARLRQTWAKRHNWEERARKLVTYVERQFPKVSVVIVCYNNLHFTEACVHSLLEFSDYPALEIVLIDNASTDGTAQFLKGLAREHSHIKVILNHENAGFSKGNNIGVKAAQGEFVILLNNDTFVTQGWVRDLIRPMQLDPTIGMAGPLTNNIGNQQKIAIAYRDMQAMARESRRFTLPRRRTTFEVDKLAFFCVAIRRGVIERIGELDETFGLGFFEDDDYCLRAREVGYRLVICDDVFVHHHLSASFEKLPNADKLALMQRNRDIFERKWGRPWTPHRYRDAPGFGE